MAELQLLKSRLQSEHKSNDQMREVERVANLASFSMSIDALNQVLHILRHTEAEDANSSRL